MKKELEKLEWMTCYLKSIREKTQFPKQETNLALKTFIKYLLGIFLPEIPVDFGSFKWSESKAETLLRWQNRRPGLIQSSSHFMYKILGSLFVLLLNTVIYLCIFIWILTIWQSRVKAKILGLTHSLWRHSLSSPVQFLELYFYSTCSQFLLLLC